MNNTIDLSIVIPAFNEENRLGRTLKNTLEFFKDLNIAFQIVVVDDGSQDGTTNLVRELMLQNSELSLLSYPKNEGKGYAVKFGVINSSGKKVLIMDADGATPLPEYLKLNSKLEEGYLVAIGSRAMLGLDSAVKTVWYRKAIGRVFNWLVNFILVPGIKDTQCGFKLFQGDLARSVFKEQRTYGFAFDCEVLSLCQRRDIKIAEVPINWNNVEGSKVNLLIHPMLMLVDLIKLRLFRAIKSV